MLIPEMDEEIYKGLHWFRYSIEQIHPDLIPPTLEGHFPYNHPARQVLESGWKTSLNGEWKYFPDKKDSNE